MDYSSEVRKINIVRELEKRGIRHLDSGNASEKIGYVKFGNMINGQEHTVVILITESSVVNACINLAKLNDAYKRRDILEFINKFNCENSILTMTLNGEGIIRAHISYVSRHEDFIAETFIDYVSELISVLDEGALKELLSVLYS